MKEELTVGTLIESMKQFPPESPVKFMIDSGTKKSYISKMQDANDETIAIIVVGTGL